MDRGIQPDGFGESLRARRRSAGLTQQALADLTGISVAAIRDLEQGRRTKPRLRTVALLTSALDLGDSAVPAAGRVASGGSPVPGSTFRSAGRSTGRAGLRLQALGPLEAWQNGRQVDLGPPRQRTVLGQLALSPDRLVHRETIIDVLWGEDPPAAAANLVQAYVSRLRRALEPHRPSRDSAGLLTSSGASYRLRIGAGQLDVLDFRRLRDRARASRAAGDLAAACRWYDKALALWHGSPVDDLELLRGHPAVAGLRSEQAATIIEHAEVASDAGWHEQALPRLRSLAVSDPLNEKAHAQLMIALSGCGYQAAALEVFDGIRRRLDDQLGIEPGQVLTEVRMRVLRQEIRAPDDPYSMATGAVIPRQLPGAVRHFAGREQELKTLSRLLTETGESGGTVVISAIHGTAGVGKTALAIYWARQVAESFPDGQLYVNLRGFDSTGVPVSTAEAIRGFLDAFGVPAQRIPASVDAQVAMYRSLATGRRLLILLDNARDADQVRGLLPGSPGCLAVVTSRRQLSSLVASDGAYPMSLDVLTAAEGLDLLARRLGAERIANEPKAATDLVELCARLPLALNVAAARATINPSHGLAALVTELQDARGRLDVLDAGDPAVGLRSMFSWSYQQLSPPAAQMFRLLGVHPGPDISVAAAASLAGMARGQARQVLNELVGAHLIVEHARGRFTFHDLLRVYAAECAESAGDRAGSRAALCRVLDHYLHTANEADRLLNPARPAITLAEIDPAVVPETLDDTAHALRWLQSEHRVLLSAVIAAQAADLHARVWQLAWAMVTFLDRQGHSQDWGNVLETARAAALRLGDANVLARVHLELAYAKTRLGCEKDAQADLRRALELFEQFGDRLGQARVHNAFTVALERQRRPREALLHAEQAQSLCRAVGHVLGQARALNAIGWYQSQLGQHSEAIRSCKRALRIQRQHGDQLGQAATWDSLGYIHHLIGQPAEAVTCYLRALALFETIGDRHYQSVTLNRIGDAYLADGHPARAQESWRQALLSDHQHPDTEQIRAKLRSLAAVSG